MNHIDFLGVRFVDYNLDQALAWIDCAAERPRFAYVVTPNVDHVVELADPGKENWRERYRMAVSASDMCLNDSRILQRLARLSGIRLPVTPGSDIVRTLIDKRREQYGKLALVGGTEREKEWLQAALPFHSVIQCNPPMGVRDNLDLQREIANFVDRVQADILLFAIGAPQSEIVAHLVAERGKARGVALCIGASVEFLSGTQRRAPIWMQRFGLEWLFRLLQEPRRLGRRYLGRGPRIFRIWWLNRKQA